MRCSAVTGIEFAYGAGLATEATIGVTPVVPDLIELTIGFSLDQAVIVAWILGLD